MLVLKERVLVGENTSWNVAGDGSIIAPAPTQVDEKQRPFIAQVGGQWMAINTQNINEWRDW